MQQSPGHICFAGAFEYYERDGEVYQANVNNVFDVRTGYRIGRWECSISHWRTYNPAQWLMPQTEA